MFQLLAKYFWKPFTLTAAASVAGTSIHKKDTGSGTITLINSDKKIEDIMKIFKSLNKSGLLIKSFSKELRMKQLSKEINLLACC